jgi:hypothetical protein
MFRLFTPVRARFAAFCWGVGALACTDLAAPDHLSADIGGQSGDGSGIGGGQTGDGAGIAKIGAVQCAHKTTAWQGDLDEKVPALDLAPSEVLDRVEASVEETLGWVINERLGTTEGRTEITVDLHYEDGEVRLREPDTAQQMVQEESFDAAPAESYVSQASRYCGTVLELELEATLTTADGALDETFTVLVTANTPDAAHFEGWLPEDLDGAFGARVTKAKSRLYVASMITALGSSGEILVIPTRQGEDEPAAPAERIAVWPVLDPAVCNDANYGTFFTHQTASGDNVRTMFEALVPPLELPLQWNRTPNWPEACSPDTTESEHCQTTLHVQAGEAPERWCLSASPFESAFLARAPLALDLRTDDARVDAHHTATATLNGGADGSVSAYLSVFEQDVVESGVELGFPNLELVPNTEAILVFDLNVDPNYAGGQLNVNGHAFPSEAPDDDGAPEDTSLEVLVEASIGGE